MEGKCDIRHQPFQNRRHGFTTHTRCYATNRYVGNTFLQTRLFFRATNTGEKWLSSNAPQTCRWKMARFSRPYFIAPQTCRWKMAPFRCASFYRATNTRVENGSLQTRLSILRHKHARGIWLPSVAPLFIAPQTCRWKMARFRRASFYRDTNTLVENGSVRTDSKADAFTPRLYNTDRASASGTRPVDLPSNATGVWWL